MSKRPCVAIDGPAGSGKSTVARAVAERLGLLYLDSGAMYRAVACAALQAGIAAEDADALEALARSLCFEWKPGPRGMHLWVNGRDVSEAIRTPEVSDLASKISVHSGVRRVLVAAQRTSADGGGVLMEGRDIQTVVLPDAEVKIFLTASVEERARRRFRELRARGVETSWEEVEEQVRSRDLRDSNRADSPLKAAPDAVLLLTDDLSFEEVVDRVVEIVEELTGYPPDEGVDA